ncbi:hypothetical protein [Aeoliella sp.]|uniref:hypothetical protein n=1 Tax=Aeoliella sp. TaxID=2795800 RepID=UPI003CCB96D3
MAIQVVLKPSFKVTAAFLTVASLGGFYFAVWLPTERNYPRVIDGEGMTLRDGTRLSWDALTGVQSRPAEVLWLHFGKLRAVIAPTSIDPDDQVLALVKNKTEHLA